MVLPSTFKNRMILRNLSNLVVSSNLIEETSFRYIWHSNDGESVDTVAKGPLDVSEYLNFVKLPTLSRIADGATTTNLTFPRPSRSTKKSFALLTKSTVSIPLKSNNEVVFACSAFVDGSTINAREKGARHKARIARKSPLVCEMRYYASIIW
jgi:hypothetical protein